MSSSNTVLSELRQGQSILRSVANVSLSRLRVPLEAGARILDAGGPTTTSWESIALPESHSKIAANFDVERRPDVIADLDGPWPLASACFDAVVSLWVLEHLRHPQNFFHEGFRCLKPGGVLLLTTVLTHPKHSSPHDYFRYTDDGLRSLSLDAGFASAEAVPLLGGPMQSFCAAWSPWLVFPLLRYLFLSASRSADWVLGKLAPGVTSGWCVGYILLARKDRRGDP